MKRGIFISLEVLVKNYQEGDKQAAELLRRKFYPLIYKLSHRRTVYNILGEDAENIAWVLFFEFLTNYHGCDFIRLPGLLKRFLIFRLMRCLERCGLEWDVQTKVKQAAKVDVDVEDEALALALKQELGKLPGKQQQVLQAIYYGNASQAQVAGKLQCSTRSVRQYKNMGLQTLRAQLKIS